jgi:hypothetical protein|tara:strand:+ start:273 stop:809 length:537 start_codon:yes stop_codon:yes gene_type:complete
MADEYKMGRSFRPTASMIAEGVSGSPADPGLMIHNMKVAARKEQMGESIQPVNPGTYEGAGGYGYEVMADGSVKIVKAPKDRGLGTVLTKGMAYEAIMGELASADQTDSLRSEEMAIQDQMLAESTERLADRAGGVVAGEGRSGMAMQEEPQQRPKIEMSPEAQLAFDRVKSRTSRDT